MLPIINLLAVIITYKSYILHNHIILQNLTTNLLTIDKHFIEAMVC